MKYHLYTEGFHHQGIVKHGKIEDKQHFLVIVSASKTIRCAMLIKWRPSNCFRV